MKNETKLDEKESRNLEKWLILFAVILVSVIGTFMLMAEHAEISNVSEGNIRAATLSGVEYPVSAEVTDEIENVEQPDEENKININTATKSELMFLDGIGEKKAESIIAYREKTPFSKIEDIMNVKGIGQKTYEKNKDFICVE